MTRAIILTLQPGLWKMELLDLLSGDSAWGTSWTPSKLHLASGWLSRVRQEMSTSIYPGCLCHKPEPLANRSWTPLCMTFAGMDRG